MFHRHKPSHGVLCLQAANMLVRKDSSGALQLVLLDHGLYRCVSPKSAHKRECCAMAPRGSPTTRCLPVPSAFGITECGNASRGLDLTWLQVVSGQAVQTCSIIVSTIQFYG